MQQKQRRQPEELRHGRARLVEHLRLQPAVHEAPQHQQAHHRRQRRLRLTRHHHTHAHVRQRRDVLRRALARQHLVLELPGGVERVGVGDRRDGVQQLRFSARARAHAQVRLEELLLLDELGELVPEVNDLVDGAVAVLRACFGLLCASRATVIPTLHLDRLLVQRAHHAGDVLVAQLLEEGVAVVQADQHRLV